MILQTQSIFSNHSTHFPNSINFSSSSYRRHRPFCVISSVASPPPAATETTSTSNNKPSSTEVSSTIMELCSIATLSTLTPEGFPLGIGVRFAVEPQQGTPILCFNTLITDLDSRNRLHRAFRSRRMLRPELSNPPQLETPAISLNRLLAQPPD